MPPTVFTAPGEAPATFNRWEIPVKMGLLIGLLSIVLSTLNYMFIMPASYGAFFIMTKVILVLSVLMYGVTGARQRQAIGGFINIRDAFTAIFIAILISTIMTTIWGVVYARVIDPELPMKIKESTLAFMKGRKMPPVELNKKALDLDRQIGSSIRPGALIYAYAESLILTSIFGFICALVVKRAPTRQMM